MTSQSRPAAVIGQLHHIELLVLSMRRAKA
jgi:hypothetical protein